VPCVLPKRKARLQKLNFSEYQNLYYGCTLPMLDVNSLWERSHCPRSSRACFGAWSVQQHIGGHVPHITRVDHGIFRAGRTAKFYRLEDNDQTEVKYQHFYTAAARLRMAPFFILGNDGLGVGSQWVIRITSLNSGRTGNRLLSLPRP
jgi:hypothetical protein